MHTAPNSPLTGFQVRDVKKFSPNFCKAGHDSLPSW